MCCILREHLDCLYSWCCCGAATAAFPPLLKKAATFVFSFSIAAPKAATHFALRVSVLMGAPSACSSVAAPEETLRCSAPSCGCCTCSSCCGWRSFCRSGSLKEAKPGCWCRCCVGFACVVANSTALASGAFTPAERGRPEERREKERTGIALYTAKGFGVRCMHADSSCGWPTATTCRCSRQLGKTA